MKVKIIKLEVPSEDEWGRADPVLTVELPRGEQVQVHLSYHSDRTLGATKARRRVLQEIVYAVRSRQNRDALFNAAKALGTEFEVDLTEDGEEE